MFSLNSVTVQIKLQLGHFVQRPSGVSFFSAVLVRIPFFIRRNQPLLLSSLCPSSPARFASKSSSCFILEVVCFELSHASIAALCGNLAAKILNNGDFRASCPYDGKKSK